MEERGGEASPQQDVCLWGHNTRGEIHFGFIRTVIASSIITAKRFLSHLLMWPPLTSPHQGERYTAQRMSNTPSMHTGAPVRWAFFLSTKLNSWTWMQSGRTSCFSGFWNYGAGKNKYEYKCSLLWNQIKFLIGQFCRWCSRWVNIYSLSPPCCVPLSLTGKSIPSPTQHKSISVTGPFLLKHSYVLESQDYVSAFKRRTEANRIEEVLVHIQTEKSSKMRPIWLFSSQKFVPH